MGESIVFIVILLISNSSVKINGNSLAIVVCSFTLWQSLRVHIPPFQIYRAFCIPQNYEMGFFVKYQDCVYDVRAVSNKISRDSIPFDVEFLKNVPIQNVWIKSVMFRWHISGFLASISMPLIGVNLCLHLMWLLQAYWYYQMKRECEKRGSCQHQPKKEARIKKNEDMLASKRELIYITLLWY